MMLHETVNRNKVASNNSKIKKEKNKTQQNTELSLALLIAKSEPSDKKTQKKLASHFVKARRIGEDESNITLNNPAKTHPHAKHGKRSPNDNRTKPRPDSSGKSHASDRHSGGRPSGGRPSGGRPSGGRSKSPAAHEVQTSSVKPDILQKQSSIAFVTADAPKIIPSDSAQIIREHGQSTRPSSLIRPSGIAADETTPGNRTNDESKIIQQTSHDKVLEHDNFVSKTPLNERKESQKDEHPSQLESLENKTEELPEAIEPTQMKASQVVKPSVLETSELALKKSAQKLKDEKKEETDEKSKEKKTDKKSKCNPEATLKARRPCCFEARQCQTFNDFEYQRNRFSAACSPVTPTYFEPLPFSSHECRLQQHNCPQLFYPSPSEQDYKHPYINRKTDYNRNMEYFEDSSFSQPHHLSYEEEIDPCISRKALKYYNDIDRNNYQRLNRNDCYEQKQICINSTRIAPQDGFRGKLSANDDNRNIQQEYIHGPRIVSTPRCAPYPRDVSYNVDYSQGEQGYFETPKCNPDFMHVRREAPCDPSTSRSKNMSYPRDVRYETQAIPLDQDYIEMPQVSTIQHNVRNETPCNQVYFSRPKYESYSHEGRYEMQSGPYNQGFVETPQITPLPNMYGQKCNEMTSTPCKPFSFQRPTGKPNVQDARKTTQIKSSSVDKQDVNKAIVMCIRKCFDLADKQIVDQTEKSERFIDFDIEKINTPDKPQLTFEERGQSPDKSQSKMAERGQSECPSIHKMLQIDEQTEPENQRSQAIKVSRDQNDSERQNLTRKFPSKSQELRFSETPAIRGAGRKLQSTQQDRMGVHKQEEYGINLSEKSFDDSDFKYSDRQNAGQNRRSNTQSILDVLEQINEIVNAAYNLYCEVLNSSSEQQKQQYIPPATTQTPKGPPNSVFQLPGKLSQLNCQSIWKQIETMCPTTSTQTDSSKATNTRNIIPCQDQDKTPSAISEIRYIFR